MLGRSHTAVVERNVWWQNGAASEPYECGWAKEAIVFVRLLERRGDHRGAEARIQISPDGMNWADEGTSCALPDAADGVSFARVREFGSWLRICVHLPDGSAIKVVVTIALK